MVNQYQWLSKVKHDDGWSYLVRLIDSDGAPPAKQPVIYESLQDGPPAALRAADNG